MMNVYLKKKLVAKFGASFGGLDWVWVFIVFGPWPPDISGPVALSVPSQLQNSI